VQQRRQALDDVAQEPAGMSLLVLAPGADWRRASSVIEEAGGQVFQVLPPRLLTAQLPAGLEGVLRDAGVVQRFEQAVTPEQVVGASKSEQRFVQLYASRFHPMQVPAALRVAPRKQLLEAGEPFEAPARKASGLSRGAALGAGDAAAEDEVFVPYAAGTVVVAVILPESNGVAEPSTEDWNEQLVLETYQKVQTALDAFKRHEPNAGLRFVLHPASAPAPGGLEGTVDVDWEFGRHGYYGVYHSELRGQVYSRLLGREVPLYGDRAAELEYLNGLRTQYGADGVFAVFVGNTSNGSVDFRANATFNGPYTHVHTGNGWEVFMHEFGHIFGAADEYCPDACQSPTGLAGYAGVLNANATSIAGEGSGINEGQGEDQPSLMRDNQVNHLNGYARGAWGWLDTDGDGLLEVRDTLPLTQAQASVESGAVRLVGRITDVPATGAWSTPFSVNRIRALRYRFADVAGSPWFERRLPATRRGREELDLALGVLPSGSHRLELRAVNSVGNEEPQSRLLQVKVPAHTRNSAPHLRLEGSARVSSTSAALTLSASVLDLNAGEGVQVRFDTDGDGRYDTAFGSARTARARFVRGGGLYTLRAQARDARGALAEASHEVLVFDGNAPPQVSITGATSPLTAGARVALRLAAAQASDAEGGALEYNWVSEYRDADGREHRVQTGFSPANTVFEPLLETPLSLATTRAALTAGLENPALVQAFVEDAALIGPDLVALALGARGLAVVDVSNRKTPQVVALLPLQTSAQQLRVSGHRLFVLGRRLTVVDLSFPRKPRELLQQRTRRGELATRVEEPLAIGEGQHVHEHDPVEPLRDLGLQVTYEHPRPGELALYLERKTEAGRESLLLAKGLAGPGGRRTVLFTPGNAPALRPLLGQPLGTWTLRVADEVGEPEGMLHASELRSVTEHRAFPLLAGKARLVGTFTRGSGTQLRHYLAVSAGGVQLVDTTAATSLFETGRVLAGHVAGATLDGLRLVGLSTTESPGALFAPGLFALDLADVWRPRLVRSQPSRDYASLHAVGSRFYLRGERGGPVERRTVVGSTRAFAQNAASWQLGTFEGDVSPTAFGDDSTVWSPDSGTVRKLDVRQPAAVLELASYGVPPLSQLVALGNGDYLGTWTMSDSRLLRLDAETSTVSRVHQLTLEARDAAGAVGRATRAVHQVPYDAAPGEVQEMEVLYGTNSRETYRLRVRAVDADGRPQWDPFLMVRADLDGDGLFEGWWSWADSDGYATFEVTFPAAGRYTPTFQVRDGFHALGPARTFVLDVPQYVPVLCTDSRSCAAHEYCALPESSACGQAAQGVCEPRPQGCDWNATPVCGCDGTTYRNGCFATLSGVSVQHEGQCAADATACGGPDALGCNQPDQYCSFEPATQCGADGAWGTCHFPGGSPCGDVVQPVCGCDGMTYENPCQAHRSGVSVQHEGACAPAADCRQTGCEAGSICQLCRGGSALCLPEGRIC
jgi:subtilisin-like proprotein convertase family protein